MPKVKMLTPDAEKLKVLMLGRQHALKISTKDLCDKLFLSRRQYYEWMNKPIGMWRVGDIERVCRALGIPKEEWRQAL